MLTRSFSSIGSGYDILRAVPLDATVGRMLAADEQRAARTQVLIGQRQGGGEIRCPSDSIDRKNKIKPVLGYLSKTILVCDAVERLPESLRVSRRHPDDAVGAVF